MSPSHCPGPGLSARLRPYALGLGLLLLARSLSAQTWTRDWPQAGDPVRVSSNTPSMDRERLTFRRQANDTLVFQRSSGLSRSSVETPVALTDITRLELPGIPATGNGPRIRAAAVGFVVGALLGGTIMYRTTDLSCHRTDTCGEFADFDKFARGIVGGIGGGLAGATTGWVVRRRSNERWRTVHPKP